MVQLVNEPTHIVDNTANIVDIIITDSPGYVKSIDLLPPLGSRHASVYLEFEITYPRDKSFKRHIWSYDKGNYDLLNVAIGRYSWNNILLEDEDIDCKTERWTNAYLSLCKEDIPNREV
jgi:hypothetical protein